MHITKHTTRFLMNVSHVEMEALRELVRKGLPSVEVSMNVGESPLSRGARKALAYWRKDNPFDDGEETPQGFVPGAP